MAASPVTKSADKATRTIPTELGHFESSQAAWERRIQLGQASGAMVNAISRLDSNRALALFADWTDRIVAGELPAAQPRRPQGVERNIVILLWDWATPTAYLHYEVSTTSAILQSTQMARSTDLLKRARISQISTSS
jgi:hypothetical protein